MRLAAALFCALFVYFQIARLGSADLCSYLDTCSGCATLSGCGWCKGSNQCLPTSSSGTCSSGWTTEILACHGISDGRIISISTTSNTATINSISWANTLDVINFQLSHEETYHGRPTSVLNYAGVNGEETTAIHFLLIYDSIIEYQDAEGSTGYTDPSQQVKIMNLTSFKPITGYTEQSYTNGTVYTVLLQSTDDVFTLTCHFSTGNVTLPNEVHLDDNSMKCDVSIENFPYIESSTKLALRAFLVSAAVSVKKESSDQSNSGIKFGDGLGYFSWVSEVDATANGGSVTKANVISTSLTEVSSNSTGLPSSITDVYTNIGEIFFSFDSVNPKKVFWDPKAGIGNGGMDNDTASAAAVASSIGILSSLLASVLLLFLVMF